MELPDSDGSCQENLDIHKMLNINNLEFNLQDSIDQAENDYRHIDDRAIKIMAKMGFKTGDGLGRSNQGKIEPVDVQNNLGRRGLGLIIKGLEPANLTWDPSLENIIVEEQMNWLDFCDRVENCQHFTTEDTSKWLTIGPCKLIIADETQYCNADLLQKVLKAKEVFDELDALELYRARSKANPFETLKSAFFMNRAALKMANIDAMTGFMFTGVDRQAEHKQSKAPYYFADVCAGPGGFSEYILWRKRWSFKGFGMTLRGENDFKLYESTCASGETFEALYGVLNDGNIFYPDNIKDFCSKVKSQSNGLGVHFVMADGGFSVEGQENLQEILSKRLYVCQCLTALNILRTDGHFVVKMFDLFTPFSVGLIYLMYHCFHKVAIVKPNSSRPANSERYLVCSRLITNEQTDVVRIYLEKIVQILWDLTNEQPSKLDITEIVPSHIIKDDKKFSDYIIESNNRLAQKQLIGLMKLSAFCRDPTQIEPRQEQLRSQCLLFWQIPDKIKSPLSYLSVQKMVPSRIFNANFTYGKNLPSFKNLDVILDNPKDWHYLFVASRRNCNLCHIYAGIGYNRVYHYQHNRWIRVKCIKLVRGSILFAELVKEFADDSGKEPKNSLHVIDALQLGDISLADLSYQERLDLIKVYCQAVNCKSQSDLATIRSKTVLPLVNFTNSNLPTMSNQGEWSYVISNGENHGEKRYNTNAMLLLKSNSNETFYSTIESRLLLYLPNTNEHDAEFKNLDMWKSIQDLLQQKYT